MQKLSPLQISIILITLVGIGLSLFMWYEYSQPLPISGCVLGAEGGSCEVVRQSEYSNLLGIDMPVWGTLYFVGMLTLIFWNFSGRLRWKYQNELILLGAGWGFLFEAYMTAIQAFVIKALCSWCLLIMLTVTVAFLLQMVYYRKNS